MSKIKIMMIVSSLNNFRCQYFPMDSPQGLVNEIAEVSSRMKTSLNKGIIETNKNKFTFQHYISKENSNEEEDEKKDNPVIFICSDLSYQDKKIEKIFNEMFECLKNVGQKDSKISNETKKNLAQIFLKYQDANDNNKSTDFGVIEEYTGYDMSSGTSTSFFEISQTLNDSKKKKKLKDIEKKRKEEIENIKRWKKVKILYLIISIILLLITILSIPFALGRKIM